MEVSIYLMIFTSLLNIIDFVLQCLALILYWKCQNSWKDEENVPIISVLVSGIMQSMFRIVGIALHKTSSSINIYWMIFGTFVSWSQYGGMIVMTLERFFEIYLHLRFEASWFRRNRNKILGAVWIFSIAIYLTSLTLIFGGISKKNVQSLQISAMILGNLITNMTFIAVYSYIYRAFRKANGQTKTTLFRNQKRKIFTPFFTVLSFFLFGTLPHFFDALVPTLVHRQIWVALDGICNATTVFIVGNPKIRRSLQKYLKCCRQSRTGAEHTGATTTATTTTSTTTAAKTTATTEGI